MLDNRGEVWKTVIVMIPCLAATLIAVSRIMDARHHPFDVITGSMLGVLTAYLSYRQYFPPVSESWRKGRAYPIRTWATDPVVPGKVAPAAAYEGDSAARESTARLRNPDEERIDVSDIPPPGVVSRAQTHSPSAYSAAPNPYMPSHMYGRRPHDDDDAWSSSSEEAAGGFEMQTGYTRTRNPELGAQLPTYVADTAYHPHAQSGFQSSTPLNAPPEAMTTHNEPGRALTDA